MESPIYDEVMVDLEIDPEEQRGHDERTSAIIASQPSKLLEKA